MDLASQEAQVPIVLAAPEPLSVAYRLALETLGLGKHLTVVAAGGNGVRIRPRTSHVARPLFRSRRATAAGMITPFSTELFQQLPIVGILRGLATETLEPVINAARAGGLTNLEITMNTPGAAGQIRAARALGGRALNVGAGTVTEVGLMEEALAAGASFIVTPALITEVIERCVQLHVPVFPGALSPAEVRRAGELGATLVKVFPADLFGPGYLRSLKSSFPTIKLMPTGGVDLLTFAAYAQAGAEAFGIGSPLFAAQRIAAQDWEWLRTQCRAFAEVYRSLPAGPMNQLGEPVRSTP